MNCCEQGWMPHAWWTLAISFSKLKHAQRVLFSSRDERRAGCHVSCKRWVVCESQVPVAMFRRRPQLTQVPSPLEEAEANP